ncbi:hypothetical protein IAQ61_000349 [Plenodomus lingam]|uniref:uncharacterized protein n=1 Tax=Leptosphaeria maculans TaxID=5022 RepID=UPI003330B9D2|nr:hypothetical protein IAQ61_000349 [Plenodomus lingam]
MKDFSFSYIVSPQLSRTAKGISYDSTVSNERQSNEPATRSFAKERHRFSIATTSYIRTSERIQAFRADELFSRFHRVCD